MKLKNYIKELSDLDPEMDINEQSLYIFDEESNSFVLTITAEISPTVIKKLRQTTRKRKNGKQ